MHIKTGIKDKGQVLRINLRESLIVNDNICFYHVKAFLCIYKGTNTLMFMNVKLSKNLVIFAD